MKLVTVPNDILHATAIHVPAITRSIKKLITDMSATLIAQHDPEGVGLAAPQVGVSLQIFIMKPTKKSEITVCINPTIVSKGSEPKQVPNLIKNGTEFSPGSDPTKNEEAKLEGCLSIPRIWGHVERIPNIDIRYQILDGSWVEKKYSGFEAIIVQHEMDHLNGILFTQRVLEQNGKLYKEINGELEKYEI